MKPGIPWSVKGIASEAREVAKHAARKSGMTLGEWLNDVILDTADDDVPEATQVQTQFQPTATPNPFAQKPRDNINLSLEDLAQQLSRLTDRERDTAVKRGDAAPWQEMNQSSDALARVMARLDTGERQTVEALTAVNERISALGAQIAQQQRYRPPERPEDVPGYQALEGAMRNIVDHIQASEKHTRESLAAMQDRIGEMAERAAQSQDGRVQENSSAISGLETRLAELAARLAQSETERLKSHQDLPQLVDGRLAQFDQKLAAIEASSQQGAQRAQAAAIQTAQQELRGFEGRVHAVMKEAQTVIRDHAAASGSELQRLGRELGSVNQRLDDMRADAASERDVLALRRTVEQLQARSAQGPDLRPLQDLDRRTGELAAKLDRIQQQGSTIAPELKDLDRRVLDLDRGLREAMVQNAGPEAIEALHQHIVNLNDRLARAEQHFGQFGMIEQSLQQLFGAMEQNRSMAQTAAEETVNRMGQTMMGSLEQSMDQALRQQQQANQLYLQQQLEAQNLSLQQHLSQIQTPVTEDTVNRMGQQIMGSLEQSLDQALRQQQQGNQLYLQQQLEAQNLALQEHLAQIQMPAAAQPSAELRALQDGLAAVRSAAAQSDQRNQETLEAVHETLEQIVTKLAELEAEEQHTPPAPPPLNGDGFSTLFHEQPPPPPPAFPEPAFQQQQQPQQAAVWPEPPRINPADPPQPEASIWAEPVSAVHQQGDPAAAYAPIPQPAQSWPQQPVNQPQAVDPYAAYQPALQPAQAPAMPLAGQLNPGYGQPQMPQSDDFILAARRAAQSAASVQAAIPEAAPQGMMDRAKSLLGSTKGGASRLSLPFVGRRKSAPVQVNVGGVQLADGSKARRNTLLIAGLVLLAAVSAYGVSQYLFSGAATEARAPVNGDVAAPEAPAAGEAGEPQVEDAPASNGAEPPKPRPAELESGALAPAPADPPVDEILTGTLPAAKADATLSSIVAEESSGPVASEPPPQAAGSQALRTAASGGDAAAQFIIASRYLDGKGVEQDFTMAARWYQKAAVQGLAPAQYRLATLFERGRGVPQDIATARLWYERSAERGNVKAMHNAAVIYSGTQLGAPDYGKAAKWFRAAAEHGLKDSQFNLAVLFERGMGVKQTMGEALVWYSLAAAQDDKDAAKKQAQLEQSLAPSTVAEAKRKVKAWQAKPAVQDANIVPVSETAWQAVPTGKADPIAARVTAAEPLTLVEEAQAELIRLGFDVPRDGRVTPRLSNALRLFELQSGLKVTGELSPDLLNKLRKAKG